VLTGQWYVPWDTEEVSAMLDWMRAYNHSVPDEKKVKFCGVDITRNDIGRQAVLEYLRRLAPDRVAVTAALFEALAPEEAKWPAWIDAESEMRLLQLLPQLQEVAAYLETNKASFVARSSAREFDLVLHYTRIMQQFVMTYVAELRLPAQDPGAVRSTYMAENLIWLADQAKPQAKFIIWEHNGHVGVADPSQEDANLGFCLREQYGPAYFAFGFEFNQGSFLTRVRLPNTVPGDLKVVTLPPSLPASFAWYLSQIGVDSFLLNLHAPAGNAAVEQWLATPQPVHHVGWGYDDAAQDYVELKSIRWFDGIIFIERTTASRPTSNALKTVCEKDGF
jgi:erythromycin esterase